MEHRDADENELFELASDLRKASVEVRNRYQKTNDRVDGLAARFDDFEQRAARRGSGDGWEPRSLGRTVVDSEQFKNFRDVMGRSGRIRIPVPGLMLKMIITAENSGGPLIPNGQACGSRPAAADAYDRSLAPGAGPDDVEVSRVCQRDGLHEQRERRLRRRLEAGIDYQYELETAPVRTVAHWIPASKQALDDAPALQSQIDSSLRYGLALAEETELLFGDGTGEHLFGLVPQATAFDTAGLINELEHRRWPIFSCRPLPRRAGIAAGDRHRPEHDRLVPASRPQGRRGPLSSAPGRLRL